MPNIVLNHSSYDGELVTSRNNIQYLPENQTLYMSSGFSLYSDTLLQTTWSGFKIDDVVNSKVIFSVARTTSYTIADSYVPMDKVLMNIGKSWDTCRNLLIIPESGIYFLSISSASVANTTHIFELHLNNQSIAIRSFIYNYFDGVDVSSKSALMELKTGDVIQPFVRTGPLYSDNNYQTSIVGFLYEPISKQKVAWALSFPPKSPTYLYGPININFTLELVNEGSVWNSSLGYVRIPVSGLYYLEISGVSYPLEYKFNMILSVNGEMFINVMEKVSTIRSNCNLRSRSLIKHLNSGDILVISIPAGYNAYSQDHDLMFAGFLLQPDLDNVGHTIFTGICLFNFKIKQ